MLPRTRSRLAVFSSSHHSGAPPLPAFPPVPALPPLLPLAAGPGSVPAARDGGARPGAERREGAALLGAQPAGPHALARAPHQGESRARLSVCLPGGAVWGKAACCRRCCCRCGWTAGSVCIVLAGLQPGGDAAATDHQHLPPPAPHYCLCRCLYCSDCAHRSGCTHSHMHTHLLSHTHAPHTQMEVGIEDCLHIEFEYERGAFHLGDTVLGRIHFLLVRRSAAGVLLVAAAALGG